MHPYIAASLARQREEEFRRRADLYRLLAEVRRAEPRWRTVCEGRLRRIANRVAHLPGLPARWPSRRPVPQARLCDTASG